MCMRRLCLGLALDVVLGTWLAKLSGLRGPVGLPPPQFKKIRVKGVSTLTFSDGMLVVPPLIAFVMWWLNTQGGRSGIRMFSLYRSSQGAKKDGPRTKLMVSHIPHIGPTASGGVKGSSSMIGMGSDQARSRYQRGLGPHETSPT